jgi:multiple sugar transport system permease protein
MNRSQWKPAFAFLGLNFIGFLVFCLGPVVFSLGISFTKWKLTRPDSLTWAGLANYRELFHDDRFWLCLVNTGYLMLGLPVTIAGALGFALLLSQNRRGMVVYRTMYYLPSFTSGVALFILWKALYNPEFGPINAMLDWLGISAPQWLISVKNLFGLAVEKVGVSREFWGVGAREALIIMGIWIGIGGNTMLLYIAALSNVPQELHEAAAIDGAGRWTQFRHVTWPQLAPTTFFVTIMSLIGGFQGGFEQARVMPGGGPAETTTTLSYHIYTKAFQEFQIGYASAVSWVLFIVIFGLPLITWHADNRATEEA